MQTIQKLKAAVNVLSEHQECTHNLLGDIKKEYFKSATVFIDHNEEAMFLASRTELQEFFDRDEKFIMKQQLNK